MNKKIYFTAHQSTNMWTILFLIGNDVDLRCVSFLIFAHLKRSKPCTLGNNRETQHTHLHMGIRIGIGTGARVYAQTHTLTYRKRLTKINE